MLKKLFLVVSLLLMGIIYKGLTKEESEKLDELTKKLESSNNEIDQNSNTDNNSNPVNTNDSKPPLAKPVNNNQPPRAFGECPAPNPPSITRVPDPAEWVNKQIETMKAVGETNYNRGIRHPRKDPIKAGIEAQAKYEAKMKDSEVLARRKKGLESTNMDEWAAMAENIGAKKLVEGVVARQHKVERFVAKYQPALKSHLNSVDALPSVTDADREKKMLENLRGLKKLKGVHRK